MNTTAPKPMTTALQRCRPTRSRSTSADSRVTNSGAVMYTTAASASGIALNAM
jgi:hypothetical protein